MLKVYFKIVDLSFVGVLLSALLYYYSPQYKHLASVLFNLTGGLFMAGYAIPFLFFFDKLTELVAVDKEWGKRFYKGDVAKLKSQKKFVILGCVAMLLVSFYLLLNSLIQSF